MFKRRVRKRLKKLKQLLETVMATQKEMADKLNVVSDQLTKIGAESAQLLKDIADLKVLAGDASPELQAAVEKVAAQAQTVDDLVPDAPTVG